MGRIDRSSGSLDRSLRPGSRAMRSDVSHFSVTPVAQVGNEVAFFGRINRNAGASIEDASGKGRIVGKAVFHTLNFDQESASWDTRQNLLGGPGRLSNWLAWFGSF